MDTRAHGPHPEALAEPPTRPARPCETAVRLPPRWAQQAWMLEGHCHGRTELFFPPSAERPQSRARREAAARAVCESCPVLEECRAYARLHREHGLWGGETEEERVLAGFPPPHPIGTSRLKLVG